MDVPEAPPPDRSDDKNKPGWDPSCESNGKWERYALFHCERVLNRRVGEGELALVAFLVGKVADQA